ncbi:MAG: bifunctional folylpolyglutamate synthase/dihydrofolate synthase [Chloracidobacterium sp.]|nr:bifunctional folylpolyglutamate synthase/dihydrofolate synthase [Chloracidobacterium sp.]MDW8217423.1 folylpolyglutamate synthase/dihydrofolate synthase family protein [Acidobacteriota bacterium]
MNFTASVDYLYGLGNEVTAMKLGLAAVTSLLDALGRPERRFPSLHVAGTNGKGSTCAFLASILQQAGLRVGLYTSPHLISPVERIKINGENITEEAFAQVTTQVYDAVEAALKDGRLAARPTFFEHLTAAAFTYFAAQKVDVVVAEVGLGGRLDATNVLMPAASIITNIGEDHREWLGPTMAHIAREKAGIMKPGVPVYIADTQPEAARWVLSQVALEKGLAPRWIAPFSIAQCDETGLPWVRFDERLPSLGGQVGKLALRGAHQAQNAALAALTAADYLLALGYSDGDIGRAVLAGLERAVWPGRLQWVDGSPPMLLDGAHNPQGAAALAYFLHTDCRRRPITAVFATMRDKPAVELLSQMSAVVDRIILTEVSRQPRTTPRDSLEVMALGYWLPSAVMQAADAATALAMARQLTPPDGLIVVYGSIYLIGEVLSLH